MGKQRSRFKKLRSRKHVRERMYKRNRRKLSYKELKDLTQYIINNPDKKRFIKRTRTRNIDYIVVYYNGTYWPIFYNNITRTIITVLRTEEIPPKLFKRKDLVKIRSISNFVSILNYFIKGARTNIEVGSNSFKISDNQGNFYSLEKKDGNIYEEYQFFGQNNSGECDNQKLADKIFNYLIMSYKNDN
jgi:hypothetical protein